MSVSLVRSVLQHSARAAAFLSLFAASALAAQAQVVFSPAVNVSNATGGGPQVAVDRNGNINIVWVANDVFFSRSSDGGATFSTPQNLSSGIPAFTRLWPEIALDPSGNINVVWTNEFQAQPGGPVTVDAFYSRSSDGGATFSAPQNLSQDGSGEPSAATSLAVDSSGNIYVVWEKNAGQILFTRSADGGGSFAAPQVVSGNLGAQFAALALDNAGNINITFISGISAGSLNGNVYLARSSDGGATFSTPRNTTNITTSAQGAINYLLAVDPSGNIAILYQSGCNCSPDTFSLRSTDGGATFSAPAPMNAPTPGGSFIITNMAADSAGNINVFGFQRMFFSGNPFNGTAVYQFNGFYIRSNDGGVTYSTPQQIATGYDNNSAYGMLSQMVVDSAGKINIVARLGTQTNSADLYLLRSADGGASFASTNISNDGGYVRDFAYPPTIAADSSGNISVAWDDASAGSGHNILYSRGIAVSLSSLSMSATSVTGGNSPTGTVTMNAAGPTGGAVVSLSSSNSAVSVPATVTIPEGATSTTFTMSTSPVATATTAVISAVLNGATQTTSITVMPPVLASATLGASSLTGGSSSTGTVTLSGPAPAGGAVIVLSSSNTSVATVPSSVTVAAGFTNATFPVSTDRTLCPKSATISASFSGVTQTINLAVQSFANLSPQACSLSGQRGHRSVM